MHLKLTGQTIEENPEGENKKLRSKGSGVTNLSLNGGGAVRWGI